MTATGNVQPAAPVVVQMPTRPMSMLSADPPVLVMCVRDVSRCGASRAGRLCDRVARRVVDREPQPQAISSRRRLLCALDQAHEPRREPIHGLQRRFTRGRVTHDDQSRRAVDELAENPAPHLLIVDDHDLDWSVGQPSLPRCVHSPRIISTAGPYGKRFPQLAARKMRATSGLTGV